MITEKIKLLIDRNLNQRTKIIFTKIKTKSIFFINEYKSTERENSDVENYY